MLDALLAEGVAFPRDWSEEDKLLFLRRYIEEMDLIMAFIDRNYATTDMFDPSPHRRVIALEARTTFLFLSDIHFAMYLTFEQRKVVMDIIREGGNTFDIKRYLESIGIDRLSKLYSLSFAHGSIYRNLEEIQLSNKEKTNVDIERACSIAPAIRMLHSADGMATVKCFPEEDLSEIGKALVIKKFTNDNDIATEFKAYKSANSYSPEFVVVEGLGSFHISNNTKKGRLAGKVSIVTGGAQGFGKGIAESMAGDGAHIVIADLNLEGAMACAKELNEQYGDTTAVAVQVDVSDEDSVKCMVQSTILSFGGLDILVSNAGILIAGSLSDLTKKNFELVTTVNYTGYFLCTKYASEPMKIQHKYAPEYLMDIIEINSKSGLEGSNKNSAYAGSKFGGVGLTQSFAMELVEYGIKVNAICPGNLLDGPLWSDPERGLFRQYLDSGKVEGAKTIDDVRAFYEAKVPMKRGCTIADVARAILYVIEQQYETGQAIPVTGGQVMLK